MAFLRPVTQSSYGTTPTSSAAIDAMRRTGTTTQQMPNAPTGTQTTLLGPNANTAVSNVGAAAVRPISTLFGSNAAGAVAGALGPAMQTVGATPPSSGAPLGAGAARVTPAQQTPVAADVMSGGAAGGGPEADPRPDLYTAAKVDTSKQDKIYADQLAQSDRDRELMMQTGYNTISALQRRNASNAALSGFSVGGGSYLGGQRSAAVAGINAFNQGLLNWGQQRQGIMGSAAGLASNASSQDAAAINRASEFGATREGDIANQKTAAQSQKNANQNIASVDQVKADYDYLFNDHNYAGGAGQYNSLLTAYKNSLSTGSAEEQAAAYQALMDFITPIQQARQAWVDSGGKDKNGDFKDWYKR